SIREGRFLKALIREESRQDETWVIRLRSLPDAPETYYLMELMASHDFQTALHNYLDLEDLQSRLMTWKTTLDAFDDIIRLRGPTARRDHMAAGKRVPGAADRGACAPERIERKCRRSHSAVRRLCQDEAGGDAQLRRI